MDWIAQFNAAIDYIEAHLETEIDHAEVARLACCSAYHFQRIFSYMADVPMSEYIRRRRMSLAAVDLQSSGEKIIDVALKYSYDSPTAFNRAFQSVHGIAPSLAKSEGVAVKSYPPISFQLTIKGAEKWNTELRVKVRLGLSA